MPNLSIKDVPETLAQALRARAARHHRSLQGELMSILEGVARDEQDRDPGAQRPQGAVRARTIEEIGSALRSRFPEPIRGGPLAADLIRADRDAR